MHKTHYAQEERKRIHECKYMKIVYVTQLRSSSEKKKKYWCPYGISTHNHCDTGTGLYGNVPNGPKFFRALFSLPLK